MPNPFQVTLRANLGGSERSLKRIGLRFQAARQRFNQIIADEVASITRSNFGPGGNMRPKRWPAYSPKYAKKHPGPPTLIRSGVLMNSVRSFATNQAGYVVAQGSKNYAAAQQFGYRGTRLPARPYVPVEGPRSQLRLTPRAMVRVQRKLDQEVKRIISGS